MARTAKSTRSGVKGHVTRIINFIRAYESNSMTEKAASELTEQEKRLREKFESFKVLTLHVKEEMVREEAKTKNYKRRSITSQHPKRN